MSSPTIESPELEQLIRRMQRFPEVLDRKVRTALDAILLVLWGNVPPYPEPPENSSYDRTGTLGRTLGSSFSGGKGSDHPAIYEVRQQNGGYEAHFGTNLAYAPYVIGENQAWMHKDRWWKLQVVADKSRDKIKQVFGMLTTALKKFLEEGDEDVAPKA